MKKYLTPRKALITERNRSLSLANTSTVGVSAETVKVELNDGQSLKLQQNEVESCENVLLLMSLDSATQPPKSAVSSTEGRKSSRCQRRVTLVPKIAEFPADVAATKIQAGVKGYLARKEFERQKRAAIKIESEFRSYLVRKEFKNIKKAAVTVQSTFRGRNARKSMMSTGQVISKLFGAKCTQNR